MPEGDVDMVADSDRAVLRCRRCGQQLLIPFTFESVGALARPFFNRHRHADSAAAAG